MSTVSIGNADAPCEPRAGWCQNNSQRASVRGTASHLGKSPGFFRFPPTFTVRARSVTTRACWTLENGITSQRMGTRRAEPVVDRTSPSSGSCAGVGYIDVPKRITPGVVSRGTTPGVFVSWTTARNAGLAAPRVSQLCAVCGPTSHIPSGRIAPTWPPSTAQVPRSLSMRR